MSGCTGPRGATGGWSLWSLSSRAPPAGPDLRPARVLRVLPVRGCDSSDGKSRPSRRTDRMRRRGRATNRTEGPVFATVLDHQQLTRTKVAYVAPRLDLTQPLSLLHSPGRAPRSGELILATVAEIGQFDFIDLASGRKARLFPGDDVIVAYGARYAPDFFEANMPADLGPCDLAATGDRKSTRLNFSHPDISR